MVKVEFHFDFGSPNAYLSHLVIPEIERRTGVAFEYVPILLGGVFKLTNNRSPAESLAEIKDELRANTERSVERGTFGAPTFFVADEIFFGKDRLRDVEERILDLRSEGDGGR